MNIYTKLGINEVINANGKMTILGVSTTSEKVANNVKEALQNYVVIEDLINFAGKVISKYTYSEDACPTMGAAAGIVISVASVISGNNLDIIEKLPNSSNMPNEIIIQKGHAVNFGAKITQMVSLAGGVPIEVGAVNKVESFNIENSINEKTAAILYVVSHHAVQKGMQSLETVIEIGKKYNIPVIVDAAAEENLYKYIKQGADLVIYSGGKSIEGPTSGFICGKKELISACKKQYKGIGRAMKVSKESIIGLITAIEDYDLIKREEDSKLLKVKMEKMCDELNKINGLSSTIVKDEAGRSIYRAQIKIDEEKLNISAKYLNDKLKSGSPAIYLRDYYVNSGILMVDPRTLLEGQENIIIQKINEYINEV